MSYKKSYHKNNRKYYHNSHKSNYEKGGVSTLTDSGKKVGVLQEEVDNEKLMNVLYWSKKYDELVDAKPDLLREQIDSCLGLLKETPTKKLTAYFTSNSIKVADAYVNPVAQTGLLTSDPANASSFPPTPQLTWDFMRINRIYRSQPLVSKISTAYSYEQLKSGIDVQSTELEQEAEMYLENAIDGVYGSSLCDASQWGYVYGLGACVILTDTELNDTDLQSALTEVKQGSFLGLYNVVRWQGIQPLGDKRVELDDIAKGECDVSELGEPKYYEVRFADNGKSYKIHRSRLLLFKGHHLAGIEKQIELGCGVSMIERIYLPLINYLAVINYVTKMLQISQERVLNSDAFDESAMLTENGKAVFAQKMAQIANAANTNSIVCIGEDDTFDYKGANFANIDKVVQCSQEDLSAAAVMPLNKLFGKSPTGMNSSSKENLTDFYDFIDRERNGDMKRNIYKLLRVLYQNKYGKDLPNSVTFKFRSLWVPDEEEKALIIDRKMRPIEKAWESNMITLGEYYEEAQRIGKITDSFGFITKKTFAELKKSNLLNCRYSDFQRGLIVGGEWVSNEKELRKLIKKNLQIKKNSAIVEEEGGENDEE